jgi:phytoene dehydrogenase-like protein
MPTSSYDLIVLGDDLAGLVAAALAARRGMRTLMLGIDDRPAKYALGPHKLPTEPLVLPGRGGAFDRAIRELNLEHTIKRRLRESRNALQLVGPDQRIDVSPDGQAMAREISRELPAAQAEAMALAWNQATEIARLADPLLAGDAAFPGAGFWERREVARAADRAAAEATAWWTQTQQALDGSPALALLRLPATIGDGCIDPSPLAIARALDSWRAGAPTLRGDLDGLVEMLSERLTSASGERRGGHATELAFGWGSKVTAVKNERGDDFGVGHLIGAAPLADLVPLLGKKAPKKLLEPGDDLVMTGWRYVLNLVVDASVVPEGMAPNVLAVIDPERPLVGENAFAIQLGDPDDSGRVVVTVSALLAAPPGAGDGTLVEPAWVEQTMPKLRARLVDQLELVMPFLGEHVVLAHSPNEAALPTVPGGRGSYEPPRSVPVPMRQLWRGNVEHGAGIAALSYDTGVKNLALASRQVIPQLGVEGTFAAGWSAAKIVCELAGKKREPIRTELVSAG